jgi:hypothetical protein
MLYEMYKLKKMELGDTFFLFVFIDQIIGIDELLQN